METMLRRNPITGLFENVPIPDETDTTAEESNVQTDENVVQKKKVRRGKA